MVFEAVAVLLLILLLFTMYVMVSGSSAAVKDQWNTTISPSSYLYVGDGGVLYAFDGNEISAIGPDGALKWRLDAPKNWTIINEWTAPGINQSEVLVDFPGVDCSGRTESLYGTYSTGDFEGFRPESEPAVVSAGGILYVYLRPDFHVPNSTYDGNFTYGLERALGSDWASSPSYARMMAISPDGKIIWIKPVDNGTGPETDQKWLRIDDVIMTVSGDKIYIYHPYSLSVLDTNGSFLYRIDNISDPAAVDGLGNVYAVKAGAPAGNTSGQYLLNKWVSPDYRMATNIIEAYGPGGDILWQKTMDDPIRRQELGTNMQYEYRTLPLYRDGILYVPSLRGMTALNASGGELWSKSFDTDMNLLWQMPFDSQNDLYMTIEESYHADHFMPDDFRVYAITPDGKLSNYTTSNIIYNVQTAGNGIGYTGEIYGSNYANLTDFFPIVVSAVDLTDGHSLWNFTVPVSGAREATMDETNVRQTDIFSLGNESDRMIDFNHRHPELQNSSRDELGPWEIEGMGTINVLADRDKVYVSYYAYNYEYPRSFVYPLYTNGSDLNPLNLEYTGKPVFNRSHIAYMSGILALDSHGKMLWNRPTDSIVTTMAANNSTIYYSTKGGELSATQVNIAVGFALAAIAYLFLRFLAVGAVARAKARIDKNDKRNSILDFIVKNPGSSLYEIARGSGLNLGTVRYHLFILRLNHKIVESHTDGKYVRYFTNSGTYSKEEQLILSLMRRDSMGRMLGLMVEKPGISNVEIARELDIKESVVSRCVKELSEKGVVVRDTEKGCFVDEGHREYVARAARRLYGE